MPCTRPKAVSTVQKMPPGAPPPPRMRLGGGMAAGACAAAFEASAAPAAARLATCITSRRLILRAMALPLLAARAGRRRMGVPEGADLRARIEFLPRLDVEH